MAGAEFDGAWTEDQPTDDQLSAKLIVKPRVLLFVSGTIPMLPTTTWVFVSPGLFDVLFFVLWFLILCGVQPLRVLFGGFLGSRVDKRSAIHHFSASAKTRCLSSFYL